MSENNHMDDLMKSLLENAREDVPERVWEGVSAGLDKAAQHKAAIVWFRRAGAVAAAAAVAVGVWLHVRENEDFVPEATVSDMVAVIESDNAERVEMLAEVVKLPAKTKTAMTEASEKPGVTTEKKTVEVTVAEPALEEATAGHQDKTEIEDRPERENIIQTEQNEWQEDERELKANKIKTSLTVFGLAGSNNPQSKTGIGPLKSPVLDKFYSRSTVEQTGYDITYGVPLSAGIGIRLHFSDRWSLGTGLNYTLLTSRFNGKYIKVNEDSSAEEPVSAGIRNQQHYIGIPLNVYYDIVRHDFINFYAYAGGAVEKCIENIYHIQTNPAVNHREDVNGVQLSVNTGIGVEFMVGRHTGIYIDPSLRYYFRGGQPKSIRTAQPLMLSFEMGLRFRL